MSSLIEHVLHLEKEASAVVEAARTEARRIEQAAEEDAARARREILAAAEQRIAEFRAQAGARHAQEIEQAQQEADLALKALESLEDQVPQRHVDRVVQRFRGL